MVLLCQCPESSAQCRGMCGDPMGQGEGSGHRFPKTLARSCVDRGVRASGGARV